MWTETPPKPHPPTLSSFTLGENPDQPAPSNEWIIEIPRAWPLVYPGNASHHTDHQTQWHWWSVGSDSCTQRAPVGRELAITRPIEGQEWKPFAAWMTSIVGLVFRKLTVSISGVCQCVQLLATFRRGSLPTRCYNKLANWLVNVHTNVYIYGAS